MSFCSLVILVTALTLSFANTAHAERSSAGKLAQLSHMWAALHLSPKDKQSDTSAWPEHRKIKTQFHIETQAAQFRIRKGNKLVFTLSPAGLSFNASF